MLASQADSQPTKPGGRFRWRIVPALVLSGVGLFLIGSSLFLACMFGLHGDGMLSFERLPFVVMLLAGLIFLQAAFAVMRAQWLLALSSTMTAIAVFVLFAAFQNVTFQVTGDWSAAVIRARQSAAESASRPFGPDAESVLAVALSAAKQQDKRVLLHIGSPPCSACRALDEFLERNQGLFQDDFIIVNIDPSRMRRGDAVENRLRHGQRDGTPWMVILDADGHALISSDGPKGNIGFPSEPEEIAYFVGMIQKTKKRTSDEKIAAITQAFQEHRAQRGKK